MESSPPTARLVTYCRPSLLEPQEHPVDSDTREHPDSTAPVDPEHDDAPPVTTRWGHCHAPDRRARLIRLLMGDDR